MPVLPSFVILGAHRAGTTAVYRFCQEHPEVFMSPIKETNYFAFDPDDQQHVADIKTYPIRTFEAYLHQFDCVTNERVIGEASPNYLYSERALDKVARKLPDAHFLIMIRNPVDRIRSMYLAQTRDGRTDRTWLQAITDREWLNHHRYADKVESCLTRFGRERLKVMLHEDLEDEPFTFCARLFDFLGVDASFRPEVGVRHNRGGLPRSRLLHGLTTSEQITRIGRRVIPRPLLRAMKSARDMNMRSAEPVTESERRILCDAFSDDVLKLEELVGLNLRDRWQIGN